MTTTRLSKSLRAFRLELRHRVPNANGDVGSFLDQIDHAIAQGNIELPTSG